MAVIPGTQFGPYQILGAIGAGGMGEVYKARDTRLGREVAIKVLPEDWANDAERRARFEREAKTVSSLNHPHICTLYDIGSQDGVHFLVMELIEGETLAQRLTRGALPMDEALRCGAQVADALDKAHRQRVVHRDLKPANVMLTKPGVKLLDFGLAKQTAATAGAESTLTLSSEGELVGTIPYMAPEQLEGKPVDARTDIFAFGALLYEALTAKRAFPGDSRASVIASIMNQEPARLVEVQPAIPAAVERAVARCLAKDPDRRWQSAGDLREELLWLLDHPHNVMLPAKQKRPWPWIALAAAMTAVAAAGWLLRPTADPDPVQLSIVAPDGYEMSAFGSAISPDGKMIAFVAASSGRRQLWLRSLDSSKPQRLDGTEHAMVPFWSPNSESIGFLTDDKLKRIDLASRTVRALATSGTGRGGSWGSGGDILFSPGLSHPLMRISSNGGETSMASKFRPERRDTRHNFPQFLPDGKRFLVFVRSSDPEQTGTYVGTLDDADRLERVPGLKGATSQALYAPSGSGSGGHLLFVRDRVLYAQRFDANAIQLLGAPAPVALRDVYASTSLIGFLNITASDNGVLLDGGAHRARNQLAWKDRQGRVLEVVATDDEYVTPKLSADASRVIVSRGDALTGDLNLWWFDLKSGASTRLTQSRGLNFYPVWSPDAQRVAFSSDRQGNPNVFVQAADGAGEAVPLRPDARGNQYPYQWSPNGKYVAFVTVRSGLNDRGDAWICPVDNPAATFPYLATPAAETHVQFSPGSGDPRYVMYSSDETGIEEVYVRPFRLGPASATKWRISRAGGTFARWRGDGREVFFLSPDGKMMAAPIALGESSVQIGAPQTLFDAGLPNYVWLRYEYDVSPDGQRFLMLHSPEGRPGSAINVLLNWERLIGK